MIIIIRYFEMYCLKNKKTDFNINYPTRFDMP